MSWNSPKQKEERGKGRTVRCGSVVMRIIIIMILLLVFSQAQTCKHNPAGGWWMVKG